MTRFFYLFIYVYSIIFTSSCGTEVGNGSKVIPNNNEKKDSGQVPRDAMSDAGAPESNDENEEYDNSIVNNTEIETSLSVLLTACLNIEGVVNFPISLQTNDDIVTNLSIKNTTDELNVFSSIFGEKELEIVRKFEQIEIQEITKDGSTKPLSTFSWICTDNRTPLEDDAVISHQGFSQSIFDSDKNEYRVEIIYGDSGSVDTEFVSILSYKLFLKKEIIANFEISKP